MSENVPDPAAAPAAKRRRIPKGDLRKVDIIKAALVIFARDGFAGASLSNIAKVAGISQVGLLHHFPNKLALLQAVLDHRDQYIATPAGRPAGGNAGRICGVSAVHHAVQH